MKLHLSSKQRKIAIAVGAAVTATGWVVDASAGIAATRHNLGNTSATTNKFTGVGGEICAFCHTPHAAATSSVAVPLWNKTLPNIAYSVYNSAYSSTIDAASATDGIAARPQIGSVSIACLSCHDGSQAMNTFINGPGRSNYNATGFTLGGPDNTSGSTSSPLTAGGLFAATTNTLGVANLTTNLQNDHPIGIWYCGGSGTSGPRVGAPTATCPDVDFNAPQNSGGTIFWVETQGTPAVRNKADLPLYVRTFTGQSAPSVECGTCHDPHSDAQPLFLRISNNQSAVCLSCHIK